MRLATFQSLIAICIFLSLNSTEVFASNSTYQTYRFTWEGAFDGTVFIEVKTDINGGDLVAAWIGHPDKSKHVRLTAEETAYLADQLEITEFWTAVASNRCKAGMVGRIVSMGCRDGSMWTLEVSKGERNHTLIEQSPQSGAIYILGNLLYRMSGLQLRQGLY